MWTRLPSGGPACEREGLDPRDPERPPEGARTDGLSAKEGFSGVEPTVFQDPVDIDRRGLVRSPVVDENGATPLDANRTPGGEAGRRLGTVKYGLPPVRRKELGATERGAKRGWPAAWPGAPTCRRDRPDCESNPLDHQEYGSVAGTAERDRLLGDGLICADRCSP